MIKVLVVDDSALMRKLLGKIFASDPGFETRFARNGIEALDLIGAFDPDVVTLDIQMPQMDGLACLDRIMVEHPRPVVMVSSLTVEGADTTLEALNLGAVDFVGKPDGAISLHLDELTVELLAKVRTAAGIKIRSTSRLRDRIRLRLGSAPTPQAGSMPRRVQRKAAAPGVRAVPTRTSGEGLVVVGTSTGGPPALEALLTPLPADFPWPIVVAQHMPATFTGALARRLDNLCSVRVVEVARPLVMQAGHVYIGKGDADVVVAKRSAGLIATHEPADIAHPWHPSTERLVRSAMQHVPPSQIVGVLMTGMGWDGAEAMTELRKEGGRTIAEAEETAVVWGMPGELVARDGADWVLPLPEIADFLRKLVP